MDKGQKNCCRNCGRLLDEIDKFVVGEEEMEIRREYFDEMENEAKHCMGISKVEGSSRRKKH